MNDFSMANLISINLNFLIYINNLYKNLKESSEDLGRFPWLPLERDIFIDDNNLNAKLKELWSAIFNKDDLYKKDINYWINNEFQFGELFNTDSASVKAYETVRKSFEHWYWGTGYRLNTIFSDCLVEEYYKKVISIAKQNNSKLKDIRFTLQVVYQMPPAEWEFKNANSIIISPMNKLPAAEDILCICKA